MQCWGCPDESSDVLTWWWELPSLLEVSILHATGQDNLHLELVCKSNELKKEESPLYSLTLSQIVHEAEKKDKKISTSFIPFSAVREPQRPEQGPAVVFP